jgi:hypothetical protein
MLAMITSEGYETTHSVKIRVAIPKSYYDAINDPIYGYQW